MISLKTFINGWDNFFYKTTDASALCFFRILFGFFLFLNGISLVEDFDAWFGIGDNALVPLQDSFTFYGDFRLNIFKWLPPTEASAWFVLSTYVLSSLGVMIGFKTRISTIICFIFNSGDTLMRCMLFLMIFAPTHVKYSLDKVLDRESYDSQVLILTIRLMQLQFTLVYLATTLFKLKGFDWVDGTAIYYTSRLENFQRIIFPVIFDYPFLVKFATWSALFIEFSMGTLVWVKELRIWVLISGIILHLGIELSMSIGFFEWVMIAGYILFLEPQEFKWIQGYFKNSLLQKRPSAI
jgi:uncharacterized membrane protein YphA (DoxX/SURF4 family)